MTPTTCPDIVVSTNVSTANDAPEPYSSAVGEGVSFAVCYRIASAFFFGLDQKTGRFLVGIFLLENYFYRSEEHTSELQSLILISLMPSSA